MKTLLKYLFLTTVLFVGILPFTALASASDIFMTKLDLRLAPEDPIAGKTFRIYATVRVNGDTDELGTVRFFNETTSTQIGTEQPFSSVANSSDTVFIDWKLSKKGQHVISASIIPWGEDLDTSNNVVRKTFTVDSDFDDDGLGDLHDPDIDGDGIENGKDAFPKNSSEWYDTDRDGIGDNSDEDGDGDGIPNKEEIKNGTDPSRFDTDGDGCGDLRDQFPLDKKECEDTDRDGIGDNSDPDIDNDGVPNEQESSLGTDPKKRDSDKDGFDDGEDSFPINTLEWFDSDLDGIGDNSDPSDDNTNIIFVDKGNTSVVEVGTKILFDAKNAINSKTKVKTISWTFGDGNESSEIKTTHSFDIPGSYEITLVIESESGVKSQRQISIEVVEGNFIYYLSLTILGIIFAFATILLFGGKSLSRYKI